MELHWAYREQRELIRFDRDRPVQVPIQLTSAHPGSPPLARVLTRTKPLLQTASFSNTLLVAVVSL